MKEVHAVVGYLPDKVAKGLAAQGQQTQALEVKLDAGTGGNTYVRIAASDIAGVLVGASQKGETTVQVLLTDKATVETFTRAAASDLLWPIRDPGLYPWRPPINVIYVDPRFIDKLVDLNRQTTKLG
jgi:hypothetical protein